MTSATIRPPARRRLARQDRQKMILRAAIRFFAEVGFGGQTRELARKIGISQPLLYKYFPSKEDLIEAVYREVYLGRWNPYWETILDNAQLPLRERLVQFYTDYIATIMDYEWIRIFMYAGLLGSAINRNYIDLLQDRIIHRICHELRAELGLAKIPTAALSEREQQAVWALQGGVFYMAIQRHLYGITPQIALADAVDDRVTAFLEGAPALFARLAAQEAAIPAI